MFFFQSIYPENHPRRVSPAAYYVRYKITKSFIVEILPTSVVASF